MRSKDVVAHSHGVGIGIVDGLWLADAVGQGGRGVAVVYDILPCYRVAAALKTYTYANGNQQHYKQCLDDSVALLLSAVAVAAEYVNQRQNNKENAGYADAPSAE